MPINIYENISKKEIDYLCKNDWDLPKQIFELEKWIEKNINKFPKSEYVIDIGFNIRKDTTGGGAVITNNLMKKLIEKGFEIYLSEYPNE